jgi:hypothetical protein
MAHSTTSQSVSADCPVLVTLQRSAFSLSSGDLYVYTDRRAGWFEIRRRYCEASKMP